MEQYRQSDPAFVDKFLASIYVDDLVSGSKDLEAAYELYLKAKLRLATAGFRLRKFATNSTDLSRRIQQNESSDGRGANRTPHEEDQSYAKSSLGTKTEDEPGTHKVLGVLWNAVRDDLQFNISDVVNGMEDLQPTKRGVASATARFFDPLGFCLTSHHTLQDVLRGAVQGKDWLGRGSVWKSSREVESSALNDEED